MRATKYAKRVTRQQHSYKPKSTAEGIIWTTVFLLLLYLMLS